MSRTNRKSNDGTIGRDGENGCYYGSKCLICGKAEVRQKNRQDRHQARIENLQDKKNF